MPPVVIELAKTDDFRDAVHRAVQALAEGKVVAFPTETVYGLAASALSEDGLQRLAEVKGRGTAHPFTLAIKSADEALDYVPNLGLIGRRLARRCWPGPVTLVFDDNHPDSLLTRLPSATRAVVCPQGTIGLRVPAHRLILDVLRLLAGPLALTSANRSGEPECVTGQEVVERLGSDVQLVLDDQRCQYAQASTVIRVENNGFQVLRPGVVSESMLRRLSCFAILLVCTGNTCRSPMAEWIAKKLLADRLGCRIDQLEDRGVVVMSAGLSAAPGGRAAAEAIKVLAARGLDLSAHESQPISDRLVNYADLILTMTRGHLQALVGHWPQAAAYSHLLSPEEIEISDPIGGTQDQYQRCAAQMEQQLVARLGALPLADLIIAPAAPQ